MDVFVGGDDFGDVDDGEVDGFFCGLYFVLVVFDEGDDVCDVIVVGWEVVVFFCVYGVVGVDEDDMCCMVIDVYGSGEFEFWV